MEGVRDDRLQLAEIEEQAATIVGQAGALLLERYRRPIPVEFKDEKQTDPVTAADHAVEQLVTDELRARFPTHGILGEEGTDETLGAEYVWVLDPLDGTANYAGRLPFFGVSLALLRSGVPVVGCLFVPFGPHLAAGVLRCSYGNGATVDGHPLRLEVTPFRPTGPIALPPSFAWVFTLRGDLAKRPGELRNLGSICYELAMVAGGGFQYAAFVRPKIWDVAAGVLLVREAGGHALVWTGRSWRPFDRFRAPPPVKRGTPTSLRDWGRPLLVAGPGGAGYVSPNLRLRPPPPRVVRWALEHRGAARRWWRDLRRGDRPAHGAEPSAAAPT